MRVRVNRCSFSWACITLGKFKPSTCTHCYSPCTLYPSSHSIYIYILLYIYWNQRARHALTCCSILHLTLARQTPSDIFKSSWTKCRKPQFNGFVSNVLALMIETTKVSTYTYIYIYICLLITVELNRMSNYKLVQRFLCNFVTLKEINQSVGDFEYI